MKMRNIVLVAGVALCAAHLCAAEDAAIEEKAPEAALAEGTKDANTLLMEYLESKGWTEGPNIKKSGAFIVQTGTGAIQAPPTHPSYNDARARAFDKAMLDAKAKLAKYLKTEISVAVETTYVEPPKEMGGPEKELAKAMAEMPDDSLFGKVKLLLNKKLDNALKDEGYDVSAENAASEAKIAKLRAKLNSVISRDSFKKAIQESAKVAISGAQAFYTIEVINGKKAEVGIVLIWSPKLGEMADSLVSGKPVAKAKAKKPIREQLPTDNQTLLSTFGIQQKINENGEYVLVSYGQAGARTESSRSAQAAYDKAAMRAKAQIRQFAGETIAASDAQNEAEETLEYDDGSLPDYNDASSYEQYQKSVAQKMTINGASTIKTWTAVHPVSGKPVYGVIVSWSPSSAEYARQIKSQIESSAKDGAEGRRTTVEPSAQKSAAPATMKAPAAVPTVTDRIKAGADGDEDAF